MRIYLKIEYDGTDYCGWQTQPNGPTVQEVIEKAISDFSGEKVSVVGSGRTDAGVHALGQIAHFDAENPIPPEKYKDALNAVLPPQIKISESGIAKEGFHARFSAKRKTYVYRIYVCDHTRPLKDRYSTRINYDVDVAKMRESARYLLGEHDFKCFLASNSAVKDTVRTIYSADIVKDGEDIEFKITGNGFLYNMVRIIVGTLIKVGAGKIPPEEMKKIIDGGDRVEAGITMPARGLTLLSVEYD